jgi:hypothetical protein
MTLPDHPPAHVGQPEVPAGVTERQLLVVQAEQVQNGRMEVVHVHVVLDRVVAEVFDGPDCGGADGRNDRASASRRSSM